MKTMMGQLRVLAMIVPLFLGLTQIKAEENPDPATQSPSASVAVPPKALHGKHVFAGGIPPPARPASNPVPAKPKAIAAGQQLFSSMHCDGCHGIGATGWEGPSLADGRWRYGGSAPEIFESIYAGRPNGMPAYGGSLPADNIWQLVTYLQSLTPALDPSTVRY